MENRTSVPDLLDPKTSNRLQLESGNSSCSLLENDCADGPQ